MPWSLVVSRRAERDMAVIEPSARETVLSDIRKADLDPGAVNLARLKGRPGECRIRVGSWRVILELDSKSGTMIVTRVLNRRDAYR